MKRVIHYTPFCDEYDGGEPADQITSEPGHVTCWACLALLREDREMATPLKNPTEYGIELHVGESLVRDDKGRPVVKSPCVKCGGRGRVVWGVCFDCRGHGWSTTLVSSIKAREAKKRRERLARLRSMREFADQYRFLLPLLKRDYGFFQSLRAQLIRKGTLSRKQIEALMQVKEKEAREKIEAADKPKEPEKLAPVVEGRYEIVGKVLVVKQKRNNFTGYYEPKMLLKVFVGEDFYKLWGTVPKAFHDKTPDELRGRLVSFKATVKKSNDDESFGFYSRPSGGELV